MPRMAPKIVPEPPLRTGAADDRRGDDVQLHADAEGRLRRAEARHVDDAGDAASVEHSTVAQNFTCLVRMPGIGAAFSLLPV